MKTYPIHYGGDWRQSADTFPIVNPANGETFARVATIARMQMPEVLNFAQGAFAGWRAMSAKGRGDLLHKIANEVDRRREEIARIITLENGKPLTQSQGEVAMSLDHLRWFAEEGRRVYGRIVPQQIESKRHLVIKSPVGVVGAISPWNFPLMLAVRKIAPALAAGCPVIFKPARQTPLAALAFAECAIAAGLPAGVLQVVVGEAAEIAAEFLENPICRKITFTGSTEVGRSLITGAAAQVKPLSLELGGNAPVLVFDDCDVAATAAGVLMAKFRNNGQTCIAANRIYAQRKVYPDFVRALTERVKALRVGDGIEPQTQIGPLINAEALGRALEHVHDAVNGGGQVTCGGNALKRDGFFLEPTVITGVSRNALCMYEETFAPIAPIAMFDTEAEGIELANNSIHGLSAYVFTRDLSRAFRVSEALEAGTVAINDGLPTASQCPFGGVKQSGWGRELGSEGIEAFLDTKHVSMELE